MRFPLCMNFTIPRACDGTGPGVGATAPGPCENGPQGPQGEQGPEGPTDPFDGMPNMSINPDPFDDPFEGMYNPFPPPTVPGIEIEPLPMLEGNGIGV